MANPPRHPYAAGNARFIPEIRNKIILSIRGGNHYSASARYAGVSYVTFRNWMIKGEQLSQMDYDTLDKEDEQPYVDFYNEIQEAEAAAEVAAVLYWREAMKKDWKASRDWLARRHPNDWGAKVEIEVTNKDDEIMALLEALDGMGNESRVETVDQNQLALPPSDEDPVDAEIVEDDET